MSITDKIRRYRPARAKPKPMTAEESAFLDLRLDAHALMRQRGYEPAEMPEKMYRKMLAEVMQELASRRQATGGQ